MISWTMLVLAILLTIAVERCGEQLPWAVPLWLQALACAALVTAVELAAGLILNIWLGLGVWDYSDLPGNFMGQICPQFAAIWFGLCLVFYSGIRLDALERRGRGTAQILPVR